MTFVEMQMKLRVANKLNNTPGPNKKSVKIVFVITLSNFHQIWQFLAKRWPRQ